MGVRVGATENKIGLCADDVSLALTNTRVSLPATLNF